MGHAHGRSRDRKVPGPVRDGPRARNLLLKYGRHGGRRERGRAKGGAGHGRAAGGGSECRCGRQRV